jgi:hypothetical protein
MRFSAHLDADWSFCCSNWVDALPSLAGWGGRSGWWTPGNEMGQGAGAHPRRDRAIRGTRVGPEADPLVRIGWR